MEINSMSRNNLGISLHALSLLIEYSGCTVSPMYLQSTGKSKYLTELIDTGYIKLSNPPNTVEFPQGQEFKKIEATTKGNQVLQSLEAVSIK
jgi:hypothetical protein